MNPLFHRRFTRGSPAGRALAAILAVMPAIAATAAPDGTLTGAEVLVVANENAKGSVALGKYYAVARGLDPERLVVLKTTPNPDVDRADYSAQVRDPIREALKRNDPEGKIRCIVLMWGVPVRVLGSAMTDEQKDLARRWKTAQQRLYRRLAVNIRLLETVSLDFPEPRTDGLGPVGKLFAPDAVGNPDRSGTFEKLAGEFRSLLKARTAVAGRLTDPTRRRITLRQLAALRLDTLGPEDLAANLPGEKVPGVPDAETIKKTLAADKAELARRGKDETVDAVLDLVESLRKVRGPPGAHAAAEERVNAIETREEDASVDSELSLIWDESTNLRVVPNPMNWRLAMMPKKPDNTPDRVIMTARIDGPKPRDALRIIKDSIAAEKDGLTGKFYIDAGGKYPVYDANLRALAKMVENGTKIPVKLDEKKELFGPGQCPDAAHYVGWYGLQKYVPSFTWQKGAVAWHIASLEAVHLRVAVSDEWCVKMIQNGVAATLGAVNEPYLGAFPLPQDFFALLLTGRFTVAECYWKTVPLTSWRMTLIADPLYNPYALRPQISIYQLPPQLVGREPLPHEKPPAPPDLPEPGEEQDLAGS